MLLLAAKGAHRVSHNSGRRNGEEWWTTHRALSGVMMRLRMDACDGDDPCVVFLTAAYVGRALSDCVVVQTRGMYVEAGERADRCKCASVCRCAWVRWQPQARRPCSYEGLAIGCWANWAPLATPLADVLKPGKHQEQEDRVSASRGSSESEASSSGEGGEVAAPTRYTAIYNGELPGMYLWRHGSFLGSTNSTK